MIDPFTTSRMTLRLPERADGPEFEHVWTISRELFESWGPRTPLGRAPERRFETFLERARSGAVDGTLLSLVGVPEDGRIAGFFELSQIFRGPFENAYAGWKVSADVNGQGLGTEGVGALLDVAFGIPPKGLGLHRVQANIIPSNRASRRIAEKVGFREEGVAERYLKIAGAWQDHVMYAKTVEEHLPRES